MKTLIIPPELRFHFAKRQISNLEFKVMECLKILSSIFSNTVTVLSIINKLTQYSQFYSKQLKKIYKRALYLNRYIFQRKAARAVSIVISTTASRGRNKTNPNIRPDILQAALCTCWHGCSRTSASLASKI